MIEFQAHPDCSKCSLCESATNPGIPTRPLYENQPIIDKTALLIVGQNPGVNEDRQGISWVGYTGQLLAKFIEASGLMGYCGIYLANACRCRHPQGGDISQGQVRVCQGYLDNDIMALSEKYDEVIIFAIGAKRPIVLRTIVP